MRSQAQTPVEGATRFVPDRLVRRYAGEQVVAPAPDAERCKAAVIFVDVVGYTNLTERYAEAGPDGLERLDAKLKRLFTFLEERIARSGGDIMSFAGDSLLAVWTDDVHGDLATATARAAQCARDIQQNVAQELEDSGELNLSIGVSADEALIATVGGVEGQWHYVATGAAFSTAASALERSGPDDVVVSPGAWRSLESSCTGEELDGGYVRLAAIRDEVPVHGSARAAGAGAAHKVLESFIPRSVREYLEAGQLAWLTEFRRVSTLFVAVSGLRYDTPYAVSRLHAVVTSIQTVIERFEGTLTRVIADDKGTNMLCAWGIPGRQHEDDAARALSAAAAITDALRDAGFECGCGITTGRVLCGLSGGIARCEYTVTGEAVNLAARLMVAARSGILCDEATRRAAAASFDFQDLEPIRVKGVTTPIAVSRPLSSPVKRTEARRSVRHRRLASARIVGREAERARLLASIDRARAGRSSFITVEGEAGIGKSRLVSELVSAAEAAGVSCLMGPSDEIEKGTTYFAWRAILNAILDQNGARDDASRRRYLEAQLAGEPRLLAWLPILEDILSVGLAPNAVTRAMDGEARGIATSELLLFLVRAECARTPSIIVLEDVHWMDTMSWDLAARLQRGAQPLVLVMRVDEPPAYDNALEMLSLPENEHLRLETLTRADTEAVICDRLGAGHIAPELLEFIHSKAGGNPLFIEELVAALDGSGFLRTEDGRCTLDTDSRRLEKLKLTESVELVISSRIDLLAPSQQFTLRVASVVGRAFPARIVREIHPIETDDAIAQHLAVLQELDFIRIDPDESEQRYIFKHVVLRDVAYNSFVSEDRRGLHEGIARWYEEHRLDIPSEYPLLAHHWDEARNPGKATVYSQMAGENAFNQYANLEAIDFLRRAVELVPDLVRAAELGVVDLAPEKAHAFQVKRERLLGLARLWLGDWPKSQVHLQTTCALLGFPVPDKGWPLAKGLTSELACIAGLKLFGPGVRRAHDPAEAEILLRLGHVAYFNGDPGLSGYTSLRIRNYAEHRAPTREIALIYGALAVGFGIIPLHRFARSYCKRALRAAEAVNDPLTMSESLLFVSLYGGGVGDWKVGIERLERAAAIGEALGAARQTAQSLLTLGYYHYHSDDLNAAQRYFSTVAERSIERGDRQLTSWGLLGVSRVLLAQNRPAEALTVLARAAPLKSDWLGRVELHGQTALAHKRRQDYEQSLAAARVGLQTVRETRPISFSTLTGTAGVAESLLWLWSVARASHPADEAFLRNAANAALRELDRFAGIFPIGKPQALLQRGTHAQLTRRNRRAQALWRRAQRAAVDLDMRHDQARISETITNHGDRYGVAAP